MREGSPSYPTSDFRNEVSLISGFAWGRMTDEQRQMLTACWRQGLTGGEAVFETGIINLEEELSDGAGTGL